VPYLLWRVRRIIGMHQTRNLPKLNGPRNLRTSHGHTKGDEIPGGHVALSWRRPSPLVAAIGRCCTRGTVVGGCVGILLASTARSWPWHLASRIRVAAISDGRYHRGREEEVVLRDSQCPDSALSRLCRPSMPSFQPG